LPLLFSCFLCGLFTPLYFSLPLTFDLCLFVPVFLPFFKSSLLIGFSLLCERRLLFTSEKQF
jgi:hypothetical protein